jgi:hypothetical protein
MGRPAGPVAHLPRGQAYLGQRPTEAGVERSGTGADRSLRRLEAEQVRPHRWESVHARSGRALDRQVLRCASTALESERWSASPGSFVTSRSDRP